MLTKHLLEASGIRISFGGRQVLSDIFLRAETGDVVGIVGRNGQGKSTLMKIIYGTLSAEKTIHIDGRLRQNAFTKPELIRYLPQFNFLPGHFSIGRIFEDFEITPEPFFDLFPELKANGKTKLESLSGGWVRMVELYAILKSKSHFVLLDEPFTHISPIQVEAIKTVIESERTNKGIILTDHMLKYLFETSTQLYYLSEGNIKKAKSKLNLAVFERSAYLAILEGIVEDCRGELT